MEGIDLSFPSYAQHERMAAALEAIALNGGQNSAEALDAACRQLLDGTNTTHGMERRTHCEAMIRQYQE